MFIVSFALIIFDKIHPWMFRFNPCLIPAIFSQFGNIWMNLHLVTNKSFVRHLSTMYGWRITRTRSPFLDIVLQISNMSVKRKQWTSILDEDPSFIFRSPSNNKCLLWPTAHPGMGDVRSRWDVVANSPCNSSSLVSWNEAEVEYSLSLVRKPTMGS